MNKENEPEIDESLLTETQKEELQKKPCPWPYVIFFAVVFLLMAACFIVIYALGGPIAK